MHNKILGLVLVIGFAAAQVSVTRAQNVSWIRQFGTRLRRRVGHHCRLKSHIRHWKCGFRPRPSGQTSAGNIDTFVRKYDAAGTEHSVPTGRSDQRGQLRP
jgi:hypothetical protein